KKKGTVCLRYPFFSINSPHRGGPVSTYQVPRIDPQNGPVQTGTVAVGLGLGAVIVSVGVGDGLGLMSGLGEADGSADGVGSGLALGEADGSTVGVGSGLRSAKPKDLRLAKSKDLRLAKSKDLVKPMGLEQADQSAGTMRQE